MIDELPKDDAGRSDPWNDERRALYDQLRGLDPELAGLYRQAIDLLSTPAVPGERKVRLALIGHCVRELINTLPDALGDVEGFPADKGNEGKRSREALVAEYELFSGTPIDATLVDETDDSGQPNLVVVPQSLLDGVGRWVTSAKAGALREAQRDSVVVLGHVDTRDPALKPWKSARDFVMGFAHFRRNYPLGSVPEVFPTDEELLAQLAYIEASLRNRLGAFFDSLDELQDLIDEANASADEDEAV